MSQAIENTVAAAVESIAGTRSKAISAPDSSAAPALANLIRDLLEQADLKPLNRNQLDYLHRVLAGGIAAVFQQQIGKRFRCLSWERGGPGMSRDGWIYAGGWMDHLSRLKDKETGIVHYRSEPYRIDGDGLRQLAELLSQGWNISIRPDLSTHFPSETVAVVLSKEVSQ